MGLSLFCTKAIIGVIVCSVTSAEGEDLAYSKTGIFICDAVVAGTKTKCVVDTGSTITSIDTAECRLPLPVSGVRVKSLSSSGVVESEILSKVEISFLHTTKQLDVLPADLTEVRDLCGQNIGAIIGRDMLQSSMIRIEEGQPWVSDEGPSDLDEFDFQYPFSESGRPEVPVELPVFGTHQFLVDTGFNGEMLVSENLATALIRSRRAVMGSEGVQVDLSGSATSRGLIIQQVTIAGVKFKNVPASKGTVNCIGLDLMTRLRMCIDFETESVFVDSSASNSVDTFPVNASGVALVFTTPGSLRVVGVRNDSTAFASGLRKGDIVLKVDNTSPQSLGRRDLLGILSRNETSLSLEYERDGHQSQTTFVMKRAFEYPPKWSVSDDETAEFLDSLDRKE